MQTLLLKDPANTSFISVQALGWYSEFYITKRIQKQECLDVTTNSTLGLAYFEMLQVNVYQWLSPEGKVNISAYCLFKSFFC